MEYTLIKDEPNITSHTKLDKDYNEYYNPNEGSLGTFQGKIITSGVGKRNVTKGSSYHYGLDLKYSKGENLYSFCSGTVIKAGPMNYSGRVIGIKDFNGFVHVYMHLSSINVKVGQKVSKGEIIGKTGGSNYKNNQIIENDYPPHLHYSIWKSFSGKESQQTIDPRKYQYPL